jgi:glyoxylate reductase
VVSTSPLPIDLARQLPGVRVEVPEQWTGVGALSLEDADALVCLLLDRIDTSVLERAPQLRVIANCAVGHDNVDLAAATARGIAVTNTPDVLTEATAELTWALILAAARRLGEGERVVREGRWVGWRLDQLLGVGLSGKTLGILGLGRIGRAVARRASAFDMQVVWTASGRGTNVHSAPGQRVSVDELFARADVVSVHCPLAPDTRRLVDAARLGQMKRTAILVNTARGGIVDEDALVDALEAGTIFAAGLDVFEGEPRLNPRLLSCPRLVLAPHIGSATTEARTQMAQLCADAVKAVLSGTRPRNLVNTEVVLRG